MDDVEAYVQHVFQERERRIAEVMNLNRGGNSMTLEGVRSTEGTPTGGSRDHRRAAKRARRARTGFTRQALRLLGEAFVDNPYPDYDDREQIAHEIDLPERRVQIWFQNRRTRNHSAARKGNRQSLRSGKTPPPSSETPTIKWIPAVTDSDVEDMCTIDTTLQSDNEDDSPPSSGSYTNMINTDVTVPIPTMGTYNVTPTSTYIPEYTSSSFAGYYAMPSSAGYVRPIEIGPIPINFYTPPSGHLLNQNEDWVNRASYTDLSMDLRRPTWYPTTPLDLRVRRMTMSDGDSTSPPSSSSTESSPSSGYHSESSSDVHHQMAFTDVSQLATLATPSTVIPGASRDLLTFCDA